MLFSRPIARNVPHYSEIRDLYRATRDNGFNCCPFGILLLMNRHHVVDFRAYFDDQSRLRGISLCAVSGGLVLVSLIAVCDCAQNEQVTAQILSSLECRYQSMEFAVDSGEVFSISTEGEVESLVPVLRATGYHEVGVLSCEGHSEYPMLVKGRVLSLDAAKTALRSMPTSVIPTLVRA